MQVPELLLAGVATTLILLEVLTFDPGEPVLARVLAGAMAGLSLALIRRRPLTGYLINADSDTRATFETIATTGRAALADLDRMLGLLEGGPERAPLPGIAQLADLGASISGEALSVHVTVDGDPGAVSPGVGVTVYRVAQEALTNVLKHARATRAQVSVIVADEVTFTVTDDGQGGLHRPGRGLTGIEERVAMHGGTVRFGPGPHGGFEVWCRLPRSMAG